MSTVTHKQYSWAMLMRENLKQTADNWITTALFMESYNDCNMRWFNAINLNTSSSAHKSACVRIDSDISSVNHGQRLSIINSELVYNRKRNITHIARTPKRKPKKKETMKTTTSTTTKTTPTTPHLLCQSMKWSHISVSDQQICCLCALTTCASTNSHQIVTNGSTKSLTDAEHYWDIEILHLGFIWCSA